jgi:hypothetical protein
VNAVDREVKPFEGSLQFVVLLHKIPDPIHMCSERASHPDRTAIGLLKSQSPKLTNDGCRLQCVYKAASGRADCIPTDVDPPDHGPGLEGRPQPIEAGGHAELPAVELTVGEIIITRAFPA